jgi:c-di-GMP-binding flagellar brake protein YcgR
MAERRGEIRLGREDSVAVTVLSAPGVPDVEGRTFFCTTADVSVGGIKIVTDTRIPGSSVLEMRVAFSDPLQSFKHRGRVVWVSEMEDAKQYAIGIELLDRSSNAMIQWSRLISTKIEAAARARE